jgi:hypothetical protein
MTWELDALTKSGKTLGVRSLCNRLLCQKVVFLIPNPNLIRLLYRGLSLELDTPPPPPIEGGSPPSNQNPLLGAPRHLPTNGNMDAAGGGAVPRYSSLLSNQNPLLGAPRHLPTTGNMDAAGGAVPRYSSLPPNQNSKLGTPPAHQPTTNGNMYASSRRAVTGYCWQCSGSRSAGSVFCWPL